MKLQLVFVCILFVIKKAATSTENNFECLGCETAVEAFKLIYSKNTTRDFVINVAAYVCHNLVKVDSLICRGLAAEYRDELLYLLEQVIFNPPVACSMLIPNCGSHFTPSDNWNITLPPKPLNVSYPSYPLKRKKNLRILQLTDIHIDPNYTPGSVAKCETYICCQSNSISNESQPTRAGYWGTLAPCDMPYWTIESLLRHINRTEKLDYIYISGDYVAHANWNYAPDRSLNVIRNLTALTEEYFPNTPVFWTLGNHDSVPVNSFAPHYVPERFQPSWIYKQLWNMQNRWAGGDQKKFIEYRGSYSAQLLDGLRLISLNTGYCELTNFWIYVNQTDPDGTFTWLVEELTKAERNKQYVHILAHIPPGNEECLESWSQNYYRIVNRFSKTIVGQFFGHIHVDSFTVFYEDMNNDGSEPTNFLFAAPSVTTYAGLNPAYRIYEIKSGNRYEIEDYSTYFTNLSQADATKEPKWELLYAAKQEYGLREITSTSMNELVDRIATDRSVFLRFVRNSVRRDDYECVNKCRFNTICTLKKGHHNDQLCSHVAGSSYINNYLPLFKSTYLLPDTFSNSGSSNSYTVKDFQTNAKLLQRSRQFINDTKATVKKYIFDLLRDPDN